MVVTDRNIFYFSQINADGSQIPQIIIYQHIIICEICAVISENLRETEAFNLLVSL